MVLKWNETFCGDGREDGGMGKCGLWSEGEMVVSESWVFGILLFFHIIIR
jgi:hypothetical protein